MAKKETKKANIKDPFKEALGLLYSGKGLPDIHKHTGVSLYDFRTRALEDDKFKLELDRAASACEAFWRDIVKTETSDNTEFKANELLYKAIIEDINKIRAVATETVERINIHFIDPSEGEELKKKV